MKFTVSAAYCLVLCMIYCARVAESDSCAVNFKGALSSLKLSAEGMHLSSNSIGNYSVDYTQHTFDLWMSPNQFVGDEQSVFQTGHVHNSEGYSWAVEFKIKLTIWQKGQSKPSSSVLYVDVWILSQEDHVWSKTRHYIILAEDSFPWLHVVYSPAHSDSISINGKGRRLDQYFTVSQADLTPPEHFTIGGQFKGAVADVRVWKVAPIAADVQSSLECDSKLGANMLMYFPLNECQGDTFSGYINGESVCALMYGSYDVNAIWVNTSPDASSCPSSALTTGQCKGNTHYVDNPTPTPTGTSTRNSFRLSLASFNNFGYKAILLVPFVIIMLIFLRRLSNPKPTTTGETQA